MTVFSFQIFFCFAAGIPDITAYSLEFSVRCHSEFLAADDWAEGFRSISHESLELLHGARDAGQQLYSIGCHCDVILDAYLHTLVIQRSVKHGEIQSKLDSLEPLRSGCSIKRV